MTIAIKSRMVLSALAVFLGLAVASPAAWAFADQTNSRTYDIDKEDAELGDYSGWNSDGDQMDTRSGGRFGGSADVARPAGSGKKDVRPGCGLRGRGQELRGITSLGCRR